MTTYYDYEELRKSAIEEDTFEAKQALADWFDQHYIDGWNGEYYDIDDGLRLFPVYEFGEEDEDGEIESTLVDWEIR